jgi:hypothetical protein
LAYNGTGISVTGNAVEVSGNVDINGWVFGAYATALGDNAATGNTVTIRGFNGTLLNAVGGAAYGTASYNSVSVSDSDVGFNIVGGFAYDDATYNTVTLSGMINLTSISVGLFGGQAGGEMFRGNTLVLENVDFQGGNDFNVVGGFERFTLTVSGAQAAAASGASPAAAMLRADYIQLDTGDDQAKFTLNVSDGGPLTVGQTIRVAQADGTILGDVDPVATGAHGLFKRYSYHAGFDTVVYTNDVIVLQVTEAYVSGDAKALSELPLADVSFVNRGGDLIASQAIPAAVAAAAGASGGPGFAPFATVSYGRYRAETGSHVDVKGFTGDIGVAFGAETPAGPFTAGAFLEFGDGSFESYNEFAGIPAPVRGEGDLSYLGGGAFARLDLGAPGSSHPYIEASARFGKTEADFMSRDFQAAYGTEVRFDFNARYYGFHGGGGYVLAMTDSLSLDLSARYHYTHRDGKDFIVQGDRASLSPVDSSRVMAGGRLNFGITDSIKGYFGAYLEHELDGDSRITYLGTDLPEASLGGSSGVGELGLIVSSPASPIEFRMGVQGSAGRRDGVSGSLSLVYTF